MLRREMIQNSLVSLLTLGLVKPKTEALASPSGVKFPDPQYTEGGGIEGNMKWLPIQDSRAHPDCLCWPPELWVWNPKAENFRPVTVGPTCTWTCEECPSDSARVCDLWTAIHGPNPPKYLVWDRRAKTYVPYGPSPMPIGTPFEFEVDEEGRICGLQPLGPMPSTEIDKVLRNGGFILPEGVKIQPFQVYDEVTQQNEYYEGLWGERLTMEDANHPGFGVKIKNYETVGPGYTYEWSGLLAPYTNDPVWNGHLECGYHNHVFLNGEELRPPEFRVVAFRTGEKGWVETRVEVPWDGMPIEEDEKGRCYHEERRHTRVYHGNVEYKSDRPRPGLQGDQFVKQTNIYQWDPKEHVWQPYDGSKAFEEAAETMRESIERKVLGQETEIKFDGLFPPSPQ